MFQAFLSVYDFEVCQKQNNFSHIKVVTWLEETQVLIQHETMQDCFAPWKNFSIEHHLNFTGKYSAMLQLTH